jgi:hypothetical protein
MTSLNATDIALIDSTTKTLRCYRFNGSTWAALGSALTVPTTGSAIAAINGTDVVLCSRGAGAGRAYVMVYRFDGSAWSLKRSWIVAAPAAVNSMSIAAVSGTEVCAIFHDYSILSYSLSFALSQPFSP